MLKTVLQRIFKYLAWRTVRRRKPIVVAVTGTVGKTSTREAIAKVLATVYRVRSPKKNFNNEWGVPFTVIGAEANGKNPFRWLWALYRGVKSAFCLCAMPDYPEVLVLEYGIDKPGDMAYLAGIVPLDYAVITSLGDVPVHVENFSSRERLWEEKLIIARGLKPDGILFYNADDEELARRAPKAFPYCRAFGHGREAHIKAEQVCLMRNADDLPAGITGTLCIGDRCLMFEAPNLAGLHWISAILAAAAVAHALGVPEMQIMSAIGDLTPLNGRLKLLPGVKGSWVFDDTYNASPASTAAALAVLKASSPHRRIAVLGDMLELGAFTENAHRQVGLLAAASCDMVFVVGARAKFIAAAALQAGMTPSAVHAFGSANEVGKPLETMLKAGDVVLVKGSQGMRMERVVEEIMAEPKRKKDLLVRQDKRWIRY